jgi:3-methyladenine DNA glycosylase AlkD
MEYLQDIRQTLQDNANDEVRKSAQLFFKEPVKTYGIKTALVKAIAKETLKSLKNESKTNVFNLCEELWRSGYMEESFIACELSFAQRKKYEPDDFRTFEKWISSYVTNWASCDTFCNHTVGEILMKYPQFLSRLRTWAMDDNRWVRRAAAVSLIIPARKGYFLNEIIDIASRLMKDKDDLVQKGYGWLLKVAAQKHEKAVFDFVMKHKHEMPRTALRYAIEKMPQQLKKDAMTK